MTRLLATSIAILMLAGSSSRATQNPPPGAGAASPSAAFGGLAGVVTESDGKTGIAGAVVTMRRGAIAEDQIRTDAAGRFAFAPVAAGAVMVQAIMAGYPSTPALAATINPGRITEVPIRLGREAVITGVVRDELGSPIPGVAVRPLSRRLGSWAASSDVLTDDTGTYRVPVTPGIPYIVGVVSSYIGADRGTIDALEQRPRSNLSANASQLLGMLGGNAPGVTGLADGRFAILSQSGPLGERVNGRDLVYPTQFYPGVLSPATAQSIVLKSGEQRSGIDLHLSAVPGFTISGRLTEAEGDVANAIVDLIPADSAGTRTDQRIALTIGDVSGRFSFPLIPPGNYVIKVLHRPAESAVSQGTALAQAGSVINLRTTTLTDRDRLEWALMPIVVERSDIPDLVVPLKRGMAVSGRVVFEGTSPRPDPERVTIALWQADGRDEGYFSGRPNADLSFRIMEVPAGRFSLRPSGPAPWSLKSAVINGEDVADTPLDLNSAGVDNVVLTLTDRLPILSGVVRDASGAAVSGATVLAFTTDARQWTGYGGTSRRIRIAQTGIDGTYRVAPMPPGDYFVLPLLDDHRGEWHTPAYMSALANLATRTVLREGQNQTLDLRLVPAAEDVVKVARAGLEHEPVNAPRLSIAPKAGTPRLPFAASLQQRALAASPTRALVQGSVVAEDSKAPIRYATVVLFGDVWRRTALSDRDGKFAFFDVGPGRFRVQVTKPGYLQAEYGASRPGRPGRTIDPASALADVRVLLAKSGVVTGIVRRGDGRPLPGVTVRVLQLKPRETAPTLATVPEATPQEFVTDDRGVYRIYGLLPGEYFVAVKPTGPIIALSQPAREMTTVETSLARLARQPGAAWTAPPAAPPMIRQASALTNYAETFYPGALNVGMARPVHLTVGEERSGVDVEMQRVPVTTIAGRVMAPAGAPANLARLVLIPQGPVGESMAGSRTAASGSISVSRGGTAQTSASADGAFAFTSVTEGSYVLVARARDGLSWSTQDVTVGPAGFAALAVQLAPASPLTGQIVTDTQASSPTRVSVVVESTERNPLNLRTESTVVSSDGHFTVPGLPPGEYRVSVNGLPAGWIGRAADPSVRDPFDDGFDIKAGATPPAIRIALSDKGARVQGRFVSADGTPALDYHVILFPTDSRRWYPNSRWIRAARLDGRGTFDFSSLPAGQYLLGAVTDVVPLEWFESSFLEGLRATAIPVTVAEAADVTQNIGVQ